MFIVIATIMILFYNHKKDLILLNNRFSQISKESIQTGHSKKELKNLIMMPLVLILMECLITLISMKYNTKLNFKDKNGMGLA